MGKKCILLKVPSWQETKNVWPCLKVSYQTRNLSGECCFAESRLTVCAEGSQSTQYATEIFEKILRKNKILPQPLRTQTKKGFSEKKSFKFKGFQVFYDGSRHTDPHLGGMDFAVFREGKGICGGFKPPPWFQQYW